MNNECLESLEILSDIEDELRKIPSQYSWANHQLSERRLSYEQGKRDLELTESRVYLQIREELIASKEKFTEKVLEARVKSNDDVINLTRELNLLHKVYNDWRGFVDALQIKKDALIQLSANKRAEQQLHSTIK